MSATAWTELADLTPNANWDATSGNIGFISNKPSFKTVGGASIIGSGDITVADTQDLSISGQTLSLTNSPDVTLPGGKVLQVVPGNWNPPGTISTSSTGNNWVDTGIPVAHIQTAKANSRIIVQYSGWHPHINMDNNQITMINQFFHSNDNSSYSAPAETETGGYMAG